MHRQYDNRIISASRNTAFALDAVFASRHFMAMESAQEILAALKAKGVTQTAIAKVLGIQQPNAATLYTPAKNGKLRQLSYDEGKALIKAFRLAEADADTSAVSAAHVKRLVSAVIRRAPKGGWTNQDAEYLAEVLEYALALVPTENANPASDDAYAVAARAAIDHFPPPADKA